MNETEKQSIYNIYRACRLCGAGAGYKMPIIQSVIDVDGEETELKLKIKECVQIEVSLTDRMPPLICELCVDKINDFFEFRLLCQETNTKTRLRLGLPPQATPKKVPEPDVCVLGTTEPVYINSDSDGEPLSKKGDERMKSKPKPKSVKKKDADVGIKIENFQPPVKQARPLSPERREPRSKRGRSPNPPPKTTAELAMDQLQTQENSLLVPRQKRPHEVPLETPPPPTKKAKPSEPSKTEKPARAGPKSSKTAPMPPPPQKPPPKAGPKSRKREISPKANSRDPSPKAGRDVSPAVSITLVRRSSQATNNSENSPATKSKRVEDSPVTKSKRADVSPATKSKTTEASPATKSKTTEASPVTKSKRVDVPPASNWKIVEASPAPKSRRAEVSPAPKSRRAEVSPAPKSRRAEVSPALNSRGVEVSPAPKSKKVEVSPAPKAKRDESPLAAPKTRQSDNSPATTSSSKKRFQCMECPFVAKNGQGLASHMKGHGNQPPSNKADSEVAAAPAPRAAACDICGHKVKAAPALASHLRSHVPSFTRDKLACNPCELWFATAEEAVYHHRRHMNQGLPYTCTKCYDDFRTTQDYDLHITRNQCLPTYEVPDLKCDECWRYFPTYKLLEDHKCPGEGGRPGGNCSKCNRSYSLMKHLMSHEIKCTVRKKEEPAIDPDVSSRLLPMQVRVVRCDALLKDMRGARVDVSRLSHRFGLDRKSTYPYLPDVRIKSEPASFDTMVNIKEEIKKEYLSDDETYVNWDSEVSDDSDYDDNLFVKTKTADSLSTLSLKTIFSQKCLGKVPKRKRKIKSERDLDSPSIKTRIDKMIDDLGNESQDSDSLVNSTEQNDSPSLNLFDSLATVTINESKLNEITKEKSDKEPYSIDNSIPNEIENDEQINNKIDNQDSTTSDATKEDSSNISEIDNRKYKESRNISEEDNREDKASCNISETDNGKVNESCDISEPDKLNEITNELDEQKNGLKESNEENKESASQINETEKMNTGLEIDTEQKLENEEINLPKDDVIPNNDFPNDHVTDESQSSDVSFKNVDGMKNENELHLSSKNYTKNYSDSVVDNDSVSNKLDTNSKDTLLSNESLEKSVSSADKFNINDLNEDEKRFMAELDAQIAENNADNDAVGQNGLETFRENKANDLIGANKTANDMIGEISAVLNRNDSLSTNDVGKVTLDELMPKQSDLRSLDLDSISDEEFNFDL